ncbi:hypothetical protein J4206_04935 [Candidatus Woesearchaeota archaeon]|nr:hypothetical protein [Candidatus Woesearchaeota archaeon]
MYQNFLERALSAQEDFIIFGDKIYWIGEPITPASGQITNSFDSLIQKIGDREIHFALSHGTPVSDLEASDIASNSKVIADVKSAYIEDNLRAEHSVEINAQLELANKYKILKFVVDDVFPRLTAAPLEERIQAGLSGDERRVQTGEEIVREILGDKIRAEKRVIELGTYSIERVRKDIERNIAAAGQERDLMHAYGASFSHLGSRITETNPLSSLLSRITGALPLMHLGGELFYFDNPNNTSSLALNITGMRVGVNPAPLDKRAILQRYNTLLTLKLKQEAADELGAKLQEIKGVATTNIDYMAIMDMDEFRFRDLVFYRNGDVYYIGFRLPKFARQTTFDENLFIPKEFDEEGFAGDLCIGLEVRNGQICYRGSSYSAGVTYRGLIKEDAPFQGRVQIVDPVMRERYGELITICHVGGYPEFELSPDGFVQFLFYARDNFLNSHRQDFLFDHYDQQDRAKLLDAGKIITKQKAEALGFLLSNIHHVTDEAKTRGRGIRTIIEL